MVFSISQLSEHLRINRDMLDDECEKHGEFVYHAGVGYAHAVAKRDKAKDTLKMVESEVSQRVREKLAETDTRVTEAAVNAKVAASGRVEDAQRDYRSRCEEADEWYALLEAFKAKGFALKDLVALHLANYYTTDSVRGSDDASYRERRRAMFDKHKSNTGREKF